MGASCWHEFTPYDPDPGLALQRLREAVFAAGRYSDHYRAANKAAARFWRALDQGETDGLSREERAVARTLRRLLGGIPRKLRVAMEADLGTDGGDQERAPASIEELLEAAGEEGTHSILDIDHVAARRGFGAARPLSSAQLRRFFGTVEPTRAQVASAWPEIADGLGRWEAVYVVVYRDSRPDEYAFIGCSGD